MNHKKCRFCSEELKFSFCDLGMSPVSNSFVKPDDLTKKEIFYPLHAYVCENCFLVQIEEFSSPKEIFNDYAYFSSYSKSWLEHCESYAVKMIRLYGLNKSRRVIEIASNDGYLLKYFLGKGIPVLGIEPAENVAKVAQENGIKTLIKFFGKTTASELVSANIHADLLIGNNVLAHVPDINDFVSGMKLLLNHDGVITLEFPHILRLIEENQFDTIYHEHFSYLSLLVVNKIFEYHGLVIFDVEEITTHGGSLRIYAQHLETGVRIVSESVGDLLLKETKFGLGNIERYINFNDNVSISKRKLLNYLIQVKEKKQSIVCYGAAAKGNTLLNYCGIRNDFIDYVVDKSIYKQGLYLPGTRLAIYSPEKIRETKPDFILILPWNLKFEIMEQLDYIRDWGGKFIIPIPFVQVV